MLNRNYATSKNVSMLKELIIQLCHHLPLNNGKGEFFYSLMEKELNGYINTLAEIDEEELKPILSDNLAMAGSPTKTRFIHLIADIVRECMEVLQLSYKGDTFNAVLRLRRLLSVQQVTKGRLVDMYANYFKFEVSDESYYRCVSFEKNEKANCNHLPYHLRYKAYSGRFNQLGSICFYASTSEELASSSVHIDEKKEKQKWISEFKPRHTIYFLNLTVPTDDEVNMMKAYDQFAFLITYPLLMLCLTEGRVEDGNFVQEYLFSQLFIYLLCQSDDDKLSFYKGICFTPMSKVAGRNIVVPIKYPKGEKPPKEGYSKYISDMFEESKGPYRWD